MRKSFAKTLILILLISSMLVIPAFADYATITGGNVNFRTGPGLGYGIISCLPYGTEVTVTGYEGNWASVIYNGDFGYVSKQYISDLSASSIHIVEKTASPSPAVQQETSAEQAPAEQQTSAENPVSNPTSSSGQVVITSGSSPSSSGTVFSYGTVKQDSSDVSSASTSAGSDAPAASAAPAATPSPSPSASPQPSSEPQQSAAQTASSSDNSGYICGDYVRFRTGPSTSYTILGTYNKGKALTITGTSGDWTKCTIDGKSGFVFSQYVKQGSQASSVSASPAVSENTAPAATVTAEETAAGAASVTKAGFISGNNVRFRSAPSLDGDIIGEFYYANSVTITGTNGEWTAVSADGRTGYVYSQYVKEGSYSAPSSSAATASGQAVVDYAMQFLGTPYKWGGKDPSGFDCSGFVYYVFSHFGIALNRVAQDQASNGTHVDAANLQVGDVLCFYSGTDYIGHVGIYIGDGKFIHSATSNTGVIITEISGYYTTRGFEARRMIS